MDNVVTIDFSAVSDLYGSFMLNETLVTDGLAVGGSGVSPPELLGLVDLSLAAGVIGATADGEFGQYYCLADNYGMVFSIDTPVLVNNCYPRFHFVLTSEVLIPVSMDIILSPGGFGRVFLKAAFYEMDTVTGQVRPLTVQFLVPEPGSIVLCGIGLGLLLLSRGGSRHCRLVFHRANQKEPPNSPAACSSCDVR